MYPGEMGALLTPVCCMIILHAGLLNDQVSLWAEESSAARKASVELPKRRGGVSKHPYSASFARVFSAVDKSALPSEVDSARVSAVQAWLPSNNDMPIPSSRLLWPEDVEFPSPTKHSAWAIDTVTVHALEIVSLMDQAERGNVLSPGVILAGEFAYILQLAKFASSLVARQQYLPGVRENGDAYFACWKPIFAPDDHATISDIAQSMPPVVRSLTSIATSSKVSPTASRSPIELVSGYVNAFVDDAVRASASSVVRSIYQSKNAYLNVHDCWVHALATGSGRMNFDSREIAEFARRLDEWEQPLLISEFAQFRLCFRLEEPPDDASAGGNWKVQYLLQCVKDQSLLIPAEDAWINAGAVRKTFDASNFKPREQLLRALGQASRVSTQVEDSLKTKAPSGFYLNNEEAFLFLTDTVQTLEQAGFGVMLPAWWRKGQKSKVRKKASVQGALKVAGSKFTLDAIVDFDWEMSLGETTLTRDELETLAALKIPLVKIRGQWMLVSKDDIQQAINFLQKKVRTKGTLRDAVNMALTQSAPDGSEVTVDASGWVGEFLHQLNEPQVMVELTAPDDFCGILRNYQTRGYSWLHFLSQWGLGACLADDMGLGKTIQTLALIAKQKAEGAQGPVLLVCPTSVVSNWCKEAARFAPGLSVMVHHGGKRKKGDSFVEDVMHSDIVISTYGLLDRDLKHLQEIAWNGVVLDEAQNIKNNRTKQSIAARSLNSRYRIALTGTPVENSVSDLYSIMDFLNPNLLGNPTNFKGRYLIPIQVEKNSQAAARLKAVTQPFILRRLKTDKSIITDLPEKMEMKVYCSLTKEQVTLYSAVLNELAAKLAAGEDAQRGGFVLAAMSHLKQICNHPAQFSGDNSELDGRSGKLDRLVEMLEEILRSGEKALIFSQFAEMGKLIKQQLQDKFGEEVLFLHGGVSRKQRDEMVTRFQSADGPSFFVLSLKAGGTGLNLTAANHVFHFDRWWNPAVENQASDRAFRIGQKRNVQVHKFITAGTLEDKIDELVEEKQQTADFIVGSGEGWLTSLSNEELKKIFSLSKEALF
ncbi:MAG TPA: DEAD/DEAH box helicase [Drouetiella sp.]|jgi:SNF2 family DNA or RNA helicase